MCFEFSKVAKLESYFSDELCAFENCKISIDFAEWAQTF